MRSFAVIAGLAAAALAAPQYEAYPAESSSAPAYEVESSSAAYPAYPVETPVETPAYPAETSPAETYPAEYPVATTTEVISATSYVCPEPTTITYGPSTYIITSSTVLDIPEYTATYPVKPTAEVPEVSEVYPTETPSAPAPEVPEASETAPAPVVPSVPAVPYPSANGTVPAPYPSGTAAPSGTKPATPEFTGAAGKVTVGFMAIAGAVVAFL